MKIKWVISKEPRKTRSFQRTEKNVSAFGYLGEVHYLSKCTFFFTT